MNRMGVSGRMFLLVPAYPGSPRQKAIKWLCVCIIALSALTLLVERQEEHPPCKN